MTSTTEKIVFRAKGGNGQLNANEHAGDLGDIYEFWSNPLRMSLLHVSLLSIVLLRL